MFGLTILIVKGFELADIDKSGKSFSYAKSNESNLIPDEEQTESVDLIYHPNESTNEFRKRLGVKWIEPIFNRYDESGDYVTFCFELDSVFKGYIDSCFVADVDIKLLTQDFREDEDASLYVNFEKEKFRIENIHDYCVALYFDDNYRIGQCNDYRYVAEELLMNKYYNLTLSLLEPEDRKLLERDQKLWIESFESSQDISLLITEPKYRNTGGREMSLFHLYYLRPNMLERAEYLFKWYSHLKEGRSDIDKTVYVRYKKPIRGYYFNVTYWHDTDSKLLEGLITIRSKQDDVIFETEFSQTVDEFDYDIEFDSLSDNEVIYIDYKEPIKENSTSGFIPIDNSLFSFFDVNFDGKDELIILLNNGAGQRSCPVFAFYSFPDCIQILDNEIDSGWMFDKANKRIITEISGAIAFNTYQVWKWNEKQDSIKLIKEVKERGYFDADKVNTLHTIYENDKIAKKDSFVIEIYDVLSKEFLYKGLSYK